MCRTQFGDHALAKGGTGRDDDQLSGVQAAGQFVEVPQPGGQALGDAVLGRLEDFDVRAGEAEVFFVLFGVVEGHGHGLGFVDDLGEVGVLGGVVAHLDVAGADLDEASAYGVLADDLGVVPGVRGRGDGLGEFVEVAESADLGEFAAAREFGGDGDRVGGFVAGVERGDRVEDALVLRQVERAAGEQVGDFLDGVAVHEHAAKDGLFGPCVVRRGAVFVHGVLLAVGFAGGAAGGVAVVVLDGSLAMTGGAVRRGAGDLLPRRGFSDVAGSGQSRADSVSRAGPVAVERRDEVGGSPSGVESGTDQREQLPTFIACGRSIQVELFKDPFGLGVGRLVRLPRRPLLGLLRPGALSGTGGMGVGGTRGYIGCTPLSGLLRSLSAPVSGVLSGFSTSVSGLLRFMIRVLSAPDTGLLSGREPTELVLGPLPLLAAGHVLEDTLARERLGQLQNLLGASHADAALEHLVGQGRADVPIEVVVAVGRVRMEPCVLGEDDRGHALLGSERARRVVHYLVDQSDRHALRHPPRRYFAQGDPFLAQMRQPVQMRHAA